MGQEGKISGQSIKPIYIVNLCKGKPVETEISPCRQMLVRKLGDYFHPV